MGVPDTRIPPPKSRAPGADPPARAHTHTLPEPSAPLTDSGQSLTRHTPTRCGSSGPPPRPPNSQLATHTHIRLFPISFPRGRAPFPHTLDPTQRHKNTLPHSLPLAQEEQQQPFPRGRGNTQTRAPARTRPPQMLPLRSRGRRHKHKHPRAGLAPARPERKPTRGRRARGAPGPGVAKGLRPLLTCIQRAGVRAATAAAAAGRLVLELRRRGRRWRRWRRG